MSLVPNVRTKNKWGKVGKKPTKDRKRPSTLRLFFPFLLLASAFVAFVKYHGRLPFSEQISSVELIADALARAPVSDHLELEDPETADHAEIKTKDGSVAICLAGGLRAFQLTAQSIVQHLLSAYPNGDVFVHAPLDETSHKLFLLAGTSEDKEFARVKAVKFLPQSPLDQTTKGAQLLLSHGSPNGVQGLLQYFELVEGCFNLITQHEQRETFLYDWIIRTRPDGFWSAPPPPLASFNPKGYNLPAGSDWGGANDRIGITKRSLASPTLRRLSVLHSLVGKVKVGSRQGLNSETGLKAQLLIHRIPAVRSSFSFCTLTFHWYSFPPRKWDVPVFSMASEAPLNAAKCRPCEPKLTGAKAMQVVQELRGGIPFESKAKPSSGLDLCDPSGPWPKGWEEMFDEAGGSRSAAVRAEYMSMSKGYCVERLKGLVGSLRSYEGPSEELLCELRWWGPWKLSPPVFPHPLNCSSVVYSLHSGGGSKRASAFGWEKQVIAEVSAWVFVFWKPAQVPVLKVEQLPGRVISNMRCEGENRKSQAKWYFPKLARVMGGGKVSVVPMKGQDLDMERRVNRIDVLRIGDASLVQPFLAEMGKANRLRVCQLIVPFVGDSETRDQGLRALWEKGFELLKCMGTFQMHSCLFVSIQHC